MSRARVAVETHATGLKEYRREERSSEEAGLPWGE